MRGFGNTVFSAPLLLGLVGAPAVAQQEDDAFELGTIVLRGELQERTLQDSPTSATVETGDSLERRGDGDVYDVIERAPNVTSSFGEKGFAIRGVDQRGTGGGNGLLISTQVDGAALPSNQATFFGPYSTWDLEQVEVLRGPQSTQQGRNALAGAVILRSKDPTYDPEYKLRFEVGSRDHFQYAGVVNQPLIDGRLALRFSAETTENNGFVINPTLGIDDYDGRDSSTYRGKLLYDATEDIQVILSYSYSENFGGEDFVFEPPFPNARFNFSDVRAIEGSEHNILGLRVNWDINDTLRLESETTYYIHDYVRVEDFDFSPLPLGVLSASGESEAFEQDLLLRFETDVVSGVVGLFYTEIDDDRPSVGTTDVGFFTTGVPNGVFATRTDTFPTTIQNIALYGEVDIPAEGLLPGLSFTVGARYDYEDFTFSNTSVTTPALLPPVNVSGSTTYEAFLPKAGVTYEFSENQAISLTIQRGYRAGGAQVNAFTGALNEFDPEFTTNYELAYRGAFYDDTLRIGANAFFTDWEDQQVRVFGLSGNPLDSNVVNAGRSEVYGGELIIEGEATANLSFFGSVGYANTEFVRFVSGGVDLSGNQFPNAPEWSGALGGSYAWNNGVTLSADASYTGASFFDADNLATERSDDRWLLNAQVTYEPGDGWLLGAYIRNILDEDYALQRNATLLLTPAVPIPGAQVRTGEPRTIGAYITKTF